MVESFLIALLILFAIHWYGDFYLQTHWQATNKSNNFEALASHVAVYTAVLAIGSLALFQTGVPDDALFSPTWAVFVVINSTAHFLTDAITSQYTKTYFVRRDCHNGFVVVGLDQWIHHATLMLTTFVCYYN